MLTKNLKGKTVGLTVVFLRFCVFWGFSLGFGFSLFTTSASLISAETAYISIPSVNSAAPAFQAVSTEGDFDFPESFKGRWVVLFSFPNVFTPLCSTEIKAFLKEQKHLDAMILGISGNDLDQHADWIKSLQKETKVEKAFPLISDPDKKILKEYGMIHPLENKQKALRAVYFIDPNGIIRAIFFYPMFNGRSLKEIGRLLAALQLSCRENKTTPADWKIGDKGLDCPQCKLEKSCSTH